MQAALEPFQKSKDPDEVKWVKAFDPKALDLEVKKYSDDIGVVRVQTYPLNFFSNCLDFFLCCS